MPIPRFLISDFIVSFPDNSVGKESTCNAGDPSSIPGSGSSPGERIGYPFQYPYLENPMDRGAWQSTVLRVTESDTIEATSPREQSSTGPG